MAEWSDKKVAKSAQSPYGSGAGDDSEFAKGAVSDKDAVKFVPPNSRTDKATPRGRPDSGTLNTEQHARIWNDANMHGQRIRALETNDEDEAMLGGAPDTGGGAGGTELPFAYANVDPASAPDNDVATFRAGWVEAFTAGDDALIPTPAGVNDGTLVDPTIPTDTLTLIEGDNFVVAHFHRHATVASSTLELLRYATWSDIPTTTNNDFYYLLALVTLTTTAGVGAQELVRQYRAGIIAWNAKPKSLTYCDGGATHTYEIPAFEPAP